MTRAPSRNEKIKAIREYAVDLIELATSYEKAASVAERLSEVTIEAMYRACIEGNRIHNEIAEEM